jgi:peroxiredoxin
MLRASSKTIKPGDPAPGFELPTADGRVIRLQDFKGKRLLIVFLRGTW